MILWENGHSEKRIGTYDGDPLYGIYVLFINLSYYCSYERYRLYYISLLMAVIIALDPFGTF